MKSFSLTRLAGIVFLGLLASAGLAAKTLKFHQDLPLVIDTQVTETGEGAFPAPTTDNPIYYNLVVSGFHEFGQSLQGENAPDRNTFIAQVADALSAKGYLPADSAHPASNTIGLTWGSLLENQPAAERYLSGQQHDINWQTRPVITQYRDFDPAFDWRGLDRKTYARVLNVRDNDTYVAFLTLCDWDEQNQKETQIHWQTRVMIRSRGISAANALPKSVDAMVAAFGHHSEFPTVTIVSRKTETKLASAPASRALPIIHDYSQSG